MLRTGTLAEVKPSAERLKLRWNVLLNDLIFLAFVSFAQFIVWRTLRRKYREDSVRRKQFKLLRGEGSVAQAEPPVVWDFDWQANGVANGYRSFESLR